MDKPKSKILFPINASVIYKSLSIPDEFIHASQEYKEESIIQFFWESTVESKEAFLKSCLKPNNEVINMSYAIDLSLFSEETQWCITLAYQFLGLDNNSDVT